MHNNMIQKGGADGEGRGVREREREGEKVRERWIKFLATLIILVHMIKVANISE